MNNTIWNSKKALLSENQKKNIPVEILRIPGFTKPKGKSRRFIKEKQKYKKWKKYEAMKDFGWFLSTNFTLRFFFIYIWDSKFFFFFTEKSKNVEALDPLNKVLQESLLYNAHGRKRYFDPNLGNICLHLFPNSMEK